MKEAMQKLNIAKEMLKEGIDERHHRMIEGYMDLEKPMSASTPWRRTATAVVILRTGI